MTQMMGSSLKKSREENVLSIITKKGLKTGQYQKWRAGKDGAKIGGERVLLIYGRVRVMTMSFEVF